MGGEETARLLMASRKEIVEVALGVARPVACSPACLRLGRKGKKLAGRSYDLTGSLAILINGPDDHLGRDFSPLFLLLVLWQWLQAVGLLAGRLACCVRREEGRESISIFKLWVKRNEKRVLPYQQPTTTTR
jgi:hypothetical protein